ncbi:hypothetical protein FRC12_017391 [Ceratobasidium sp. 428]|nr:hypothetical protein FRC12_017391 [Ceratobasidium sp. 428]
MEAIKSLLEARSALEKAASDFLDACATLKLVATPSLASVPGQLAFESSVDNILSGVGSASLVTDIMSKSCSILKKLLNLSTTRVPVNRLPAETVGYIFSIVAASSPCDHDGTQRDYLLDLPQVCTRWNRIATNTPSLWSHIDINLSRLSATTALSRARIRLDRCHGAPIHLHINGGVRDISQTHVLDITATIQSYDGSLSSLAITRSRHHSLAHALLDFVLGSVKPNSLKTLVLWGARRTYKQDTLESLPLNLLCGLTVLDLCDVSGPICPSIRDLAKILSGCPTLHTLRLRWMGFLSGSLHAHPTIPLPQLRFLEFSCVDGDGLLLLLSKLDPGVLELSVRLDAEYIADNGSNSPGQLFLARSNVVSLSINEFMDRDNRQPLTYLASVPRLRVLQLYSTRLAQDFASMLGTTANDRQDLQVPCLQSLCLVECIINPWAANLVGHILRQRKLRNLAFLGCQYSPSFTRSIGGVQESKPLPEEGEIDEYNDDYLEELPQTMREWFSERVERIMVDREPDNEQIYNGVDPFLQKLIKLD